MKPQVNDTAPVEPTQAEAPQPLTLDDLRHVAGGLPYGGWMEPVVVASVTITEGDLPYGGW